MRRVVVTGLGAVTPLGIGWVRQTWTRLIAAHSGIVGLQEPHISNYDVAQQRCRVAGLVPRREWRTVEESFFSEDDRRRMSMFSKYAVWAAKEALADAQWSPRTEAECDATGVCLGSGIGSLETIYQTSIDFDKSGAKKVSPFFIPRLLINLAAGHVSMTFGLKGPSHSASTACATGTHSIGDAARFISFGDADVMLAGGAESSIHPLAFVGFERSRSLATSFNERPAAACRPFDQDRDGFVIGEGAGVLVLEEMSHAVSRNARIYAELKGYGTSSDAHHPTTPPDDGNGALRAMRRALRNARVGPEAIGYINAHATATRQGDTAELRAIRALMQDTEKDQGLRVSSTKGATGHLLGAAGAIEAIFAVLALKGTLPPTLNLEHIDAPTELHAALIARQSQDHAIELSLSNSFGFGGTNASLCFANFHE